MTSVPELPDVEGRRRYLARHAAGRRIESVSAPAPSVIRNTSPQGLGRALGGRSFAAPERHGKWLVAPATRAGRKLAFVLLHFGMTGELAWVGDRRRAARPPHRHDRVIFRLAGGELRYRDMRMLGGVWLARDEGEIAMVTGPLGPDAQAVGRDQLRQLLGARRGGLKATLMNQRVLAGVGNELSDEILWRARLDPRRPARGLRERDLDRLHEAMREVIEDSSRHGRIPRERGWIGSQRGRPEPC